MPFGLSNAPSTFQATMNDMFRPFLCKFILVFFDDILIFSQQLSHHIQHLELVFEQLDQHQFYLKQSSVLCNSTSFLFRAHCLSQGR